MIWRLDAALHLNGAMTSQYHCSAKVYNGAIELETLALSKVWLTSMTCHRDHSHHENPERSEVSIARQERYPNGNGNAVLYC